jgi:hypothetical protein
MCYERSCLCSWCRLAALPHCGSSELFHYCQFVPTQSNQRHLWVSPHVRLVRIVLYLWELQSSLCRSIQDHLTILTCVSRTTYDQRKHESIKFRYKVSYLLALLTSFRKRLDTITRQSVCYVVKSLSVPDPTCNSLSSATRSTTLPYANLSKQLASFWFQGGFFKS